MNKVEQTAVGMVLLLIIGGALYGFASQNGEEDAIPVELTARWQPGDNEPRFFYLIGTEGDTLRPSGPYYTHDDVATPGTRLELLVESDPEQPVVISECYIEFNDEHMEGTVRREGQQCQAVAVIPPR